MSDPSVLQEIRAAIDAPTLPGAIDAASVVVADIPCRKCGYNLRGLHIDGRCPECGRPVGLSVQGDLLRFSDPGWLRTLARGARLIIWAVLALVLGAIGAAVLAALNPTLAILAPLFGVIGHGLIFYGSWLLTEPDPSGLGEDQYGTARQIIRVTLILGLVDSAIDLIASVSTFGPEVRQMLTFLKFPLGIAWLVGVFAQLRYLRKLAMRIPDASLAGRAHFLTYGMGISYALMLLGGFAMLIFVTRAGPGGPGGAFAASGCAMGLVGLALLAFGVMYLFMIERFGKQFREQASLAERTWARLDTGAAPNVA